MGSKDWFGVVLGLVGIGVSLHAVVTGSVDVHLFRWGRYWHRQHSVDVTLRRDESPFGFWAAVAGYAAVGLLVLLVSAAGSHRR